MYIRDIIKKLDEEYSQKGEIVDSQLITWEFTKDNMHRYKATYKDGTEVCIKLHRSYPEDSKHYEI